MVPSSRTTTRPASAANATPFPSPVHRVASGRDAAGLSVCTGRADEPSRFAAVRTKAPAGFWRQYASRPDGESSGAARPPVLRAAAGSVELVVASTSPTDPTAMKSPAARYGSTGLIARTSSIIAACPIR